MRFYELPDTLPAEHAQFARDLNEFVAGKINPVKFKAIRVAHGVYEQRQENTYMIRIRCASCGITPDQLKKVADLGARYGSNDVHFTTRSEVQIHNVLLENVMTVIRELHDVGLSTRGGGGNTIRNILTSPDSGVSEDDIFDVEPYAIALTTRLIAEPDSWNLPRKFKIAFSNNNEDTALTQATCLGFVAKIQNGIEGFEVYAAGGMGAKPMVGHQLLDFVAGPKIYQVASAIKTMFDKHGNRRKKYENRIKFLWEKLQRDEFERLFFEEYNKIKDNAALDLKIEPLESVNTQPNLPIESVDSLDYEVWKKRYVVAQRQPGLNMIKLPLQLGDLIKSDADMLCDFLNHFGDNTIRCDRDQNIRLRNIPSAYLGNAYNVITSMKQSLVQFAPFIGNMINCTGASTCKLGLCLPRGLSDAIRDRLAESDLELDQINDFKLNMSGCPNTCGMHHIADLGFFGKVGRSKARDMFPAYYVLAGAKRGKGQTKYAEKVGEIAAHHVPDFVHDFLGDWIQKKPQYNGNYGEYLEKEGTALIKTLLETRYQHVPEFDEAPKFYTDHGAKKRLALDELGTAECSAGMFDMIDVDAKTIQQLTKSLESLASNDAAKDEQGELLYKLLYHSARMLLVTRGLDPKTDAQVFELFNKHFVLTELVQSKYQDVVVLGKLNIKSELLNYRDTILELAQEIVALYKGMDDSLRFKTEKKESESGASSSSGSDKFKDFTGVACPMNFVKTKLELATMTSGQTLEIWLDDGEPIQNVPNSVKLEGHTILKQEKVGDRWTVHIKKA